MLLFFRLDVVEHLADLGIAELKNGRVVSARDVFLRHQHVITEVLVQRVAWSERVAQLELGGLSLLHLRLGLALLHFGYGALLLLLGILGHLAARLVLVQVGHLPVQKLVDGIQVFLFLLAEPGKEIFQLLVRGLIRVIRILLDADLFMTLLVLQ